MFTWFMSGISTVSIWVFEQSKIDKLTEWFLNAIVENTDITILLYYFNETRGSL